MQSDNDFFLPPPHAPPILSEDQLIHLAQQGWLRLPLSHSLFSSLQCLSQNASQFFAQPRPEKAALYPSSEGTESGYYLVPHEKEYITLRNYVHSDSALETQAADVWAEVASLLKRILVDLTRALDWPTHAWDGLLDGCLTLPATEKECTPSLLRLFRYASMKGVADEHTDLGMLTLCVGTGRGLQALDRLESKPDAPEWVDVHGEGAMEGVVLVGNVLRELSGGIVRSGLHRVVENPEGRSSIVFALRPSLRNVVEGELFGRRGKIDPVELWEWCRKGKTNINARKEIREKQKQEAAERRAQLIAKKDNTEVLHQT